MGMVQLVRGWIVVLCTVLVNLVLMGVFATFPSILTSMVLFVVQLHLNSVECVIRVVDLIAVVVLVLLDLATFANETR